jgi:hypothetical protein
VGMRRTTGRRKRSPQRAAAAWCVNSLCVSGEGDGARTRNLRIDSLCIPRREAAQDNGSQSVVGGTLPATLPRSGSDPIAAARALLEQAKSAFDPGPFIEAARVLLSASGTGGTAGVA